VARIYAESAQAARALGLVEGLQRRFASRLEFLSAKLGHPDAFSQASWERNEGRHGGGHRFVAVDTPVFNRAAINISGVHYDDLLDRKLASATALSTIIHPQNPRAPSVHVHISWTEMRDGSGYWRIMGDLNPAIENPEHTAKFRDIMQAVDPKSYEEAAAQGDRYFFIPALSRHRGATHYYLEGYQSGDREADFALTKRFGEAVLDGYVEILSDALAHDAGQTDSDERQRQLAYHTLYLFQVLTLDRGTTSGLLVHDQNDVGILGSLPSRVDPVLLSSWASHIEPPQDALVHSLIKALDATHPSEITDVVRARLAQAVRTHYHIHPEALDLQARGEIVPPTVDNHLSPNRGPVL
jgi:coproporphyrinogen III oxidase